jgi:hypothetical protein
MTEESKPNPRKFRSEPFRMSFPSIPPMKPRKNDKSGKEQFEITALCPPATAEIERKKAMKAFEAAMSEKHGADKTKWPKLKRKPADVLRDFEEYNSDGDKPLPGDWKGWLMFRANATTKYPPNVVGPTKDPNTGKFPVVTDEREVYGGRWARATFEAVYYDHPEGGRGVTLSVINVQLLKHDKKFGGAVTAAEQDFDDATPEMAGEGDAFDSGESSGGDGDTPW